MGMFEKVAPKDHLEHLCQEGETLLKRGESAVAREKFSLALEIDENSARAHAGLGRIFYRELVDLIKVMKRGAIEINSGIFRPVHRMKDLPDYQGLVARTLREMETALKLGEQSDDFHAKLGELYVRFFQTKLAEQQLLISLQINPDNYHAFFWLGMCYRNQKQYSKAIKHFARAVALSPHQPEAHNELGSAHYCNRQVAESIPCFEEAISLNPNYTDAILNLGTSLFETGKRSKAIKMYRRFLVLEPNSKDASMLKKMLPELRDF